MKHYILYYHGGSANHGCEALVRTTAELLDYHNNKISLASFHPETDYYYGISEFCDIHRMFEKSSINPNRLMMVKAKMKKKLMHDRDAISDLQILNSINARKGDIAISIGGDNYCYNDTENLIKANQIWRRNKIKTVLWGCSIEPELLKNNLIAEDISKFDIITARETISYEALKQVNKKTFLVSDSAFLLKKSDKINDIVYEKNDYVGVNLSPMVEEYEAKSGIARKNYINLIHYILHNTNLNIMLIPHVVFDYSDDLTINRLLFNEFKHTKRVFEVNDCNCEELKGYISKCRFFVGARTHATIAAYSSSIPTLVLGYSVKSRGIAKDLFGDYKNYVVPVQSLCTENDLVKAFIWLQKNELQIKNTLLSKMDEYKSRVFSVMDLIRSL